MTAQGQSYVWRCDSCGTPDPEVTARTCKPCVEFNRRVVALVHASPQHQRARQRAERADDMVHRRLLDPELARRLARALGPDVAPSVLLCIQDRWHLELERRTDKLNYVYETMRREATESVLRELPDRGLMPTRRHTDNELGSILWAAGAAAATHDTGRWEHNKARHPLYITAARAVAIAVERRLIARIRAVPAERLARALAAYRYDKHTEAPNELVHVVMSRASDEEAEAVRAELLRALAEEPTP